MTKNRLEAFSDGVLAIIITIMVLELKVPHENTLEALKPLWPIFLSYLLSFIFIGIYWNNHHHMLHAARRVTGGVMWANHFFLFWLSLVPFATGFLGENKFSSAPAAVYGFVLLMCGVSYFLLQQVIIRVHGETSPLAKAVHRDIKGMGSLLAYVVSILVANANPVISWLIFVGVALVWLIPDRRIERVLGDESGS